MYVWQRRARGRGCLVNSCPTTLAVLITASSASTSSLWSWWRCILQLQCMTTTILGALMPFLSPPPAHWFASVSLLLYFIFLLRHYYSALGVTADCANCDGECCAICEQWVAVKDEESYTGTGWVWCISLISLSEGVGSEGYEQRRLLVDAVIAVSDDRRYCTMIGRCLSVTTPRQLGA